MRDWLTHRAAATPEATAVVVGADGTTHTYADLDDAVTRTASRLAALGVDANDHLGLFLEDRFATVRLYWAAMRIGCVAVPLAPGLGPDSLGDRLADADVTALVCEPDTEPTALAAADGDRENASVPVVSVATPESDRVADLSTQTPASLAPATWMGSEPMTLAFTAGATDEPKPVRLRLENHFASAVDAAFRFGVLPDDRWLVTHPFHHVSGFAPALRATLYGAALILPEADEPGALADALSTHSATALSASPATLRAMLDARGTLADSLRLVLIAGAPAPRALLERCRSYSVPAYVTYTLTEAAGEVAAVDVAGALDAASTVGRPLLRSSVQILDSESADVPAGETGDIVVSGPAVADGYYGDPGAPADGRPEVTRGMASGDRGYLDESGQLWVLSRRADDIHVDGERVRASDVAAVLREHEAVADAAVVGLPTDGGGDSDTTEDPREESTTRPDQRVGALVVPETDAPSVSALADHCRARLADFVAPSDIGFAPALPRVASGAVDRDAVERRLLATAASTAVGSAEASETGAHRGDDGDDDGEPGEDPDARSEDSDAETTGSAGGDGTAESVE